jgi:uncharacterized damage-inducible protein DinB
LEPNVEHFETVEYKSKNNVYGYLNQFEQIFDGKPWIDETLIKKLHDVTPENSVNQPIDGLHTIQEIVLHIIYWRKLFIKRLKGDFLSKIVMNSSDDWISKNELNSAEWGNTLYELETTQLDIIEILKAKEDNFLDSKVGNTGYNIQYLIEGMIHHDLYHLGQIGIVKKIIDIYNQL